MAEAVTPEIRIEEQSAGIIAVTPVSSRVPAFFGVTQRGPIGEATIIVSLEDFEAQFGGLVADYPALWLQVKGFFTNAGEGGIECFVTRIVHYLTPGNPDSQQAAIGSLTLQTSTGSATPASLTTTIPFPIALTDADALTFGSIDGAGPTSVVFNGAPGILVAGGAEPYVLADGMTLDLLADTLLAQTVTFTAGQFPNIGAATAAETAASINGQLGGFSYAFDNAGTLNIRSQTEGTAGLINVLGGTANAILGFSTTAETGTGNVADLSQITAAEFEILVEVTTVDVVSISGDLVRIDSPTTGPTSELQVNAGPVQSAVGLSISTINGTTGVPIDTLTFVGRTAYDNSNLQTRVDIPSTSGDTGRFDLSLVEGGVDVEVFRDLSMTPTDDQYVEKIINAAIGAGGSFRTLVTDLLASASDSRPAPGLSGPFVGGSDGLSGLVDDDFIGAVGPDNRTTGFRVLDALLGTENAPQIGPLVPGRYSSGMWNAQVAYATLNGPSNGAMFTILDWPETTTPGEQKSAIEGAGLLGTDEYYAFYYPGLRIQNPNRDVFGSNDVIDSGNAGFVAGIYARRDISREFGVGLPPGGLNDFGRVLGAVGVTDLEVTSQSQRRILGLANSNVIRPQRRPRSATDLLSVFVGDVLTGRRTSQGGRFPEVQQRRIVIWIEQSLKFSFETKLIADNTVTTRRSMAEQSERFLGDLKKAGVLEDYAIDIGSSVNTAASIAQGNFVMKIELRPIRAIRSIVIRVQPF